MRILNQNDGSSIIKAALHEGGADMSTLIA
jgi:hypothetical protein